MRAPLAFTDLQSELVERTASKLPVEQRDAFRQQVAAQLHGQPSIPAVKTAIARALATMTSIYLCDGRNK
jgi:hypothetical protein